MTLKSKLKSSYSKAISWLKNTRLNRINNQFGFIYGVIYKQGKVILEISDQSQKLTELVDKEVKARIDQYASIKSGIKRELNKCIKEYKSTEEKTYITGLELRVQEIIDKLIDSVEKKEESLMNQNLECRRIITELNIAENDFLEVKVLGDKAKKDYEKYLNLLIEDFLFFKENDSSMRRLASIEERCTMLELKLK